MVYTSATIFTNFYMSVSLAESLQQILLRSLENQNLLYNLTQEKAKDICEVIIDRGTYERIIGRREFPFSEF